jgi:PIN domain nuclease of toxin-antitoxin system
VIALDTHALIWWVTGDAQLSSAAKTAIKKAQSKGEVLVSCISSWEIAMLVARGRLVLNVDVAQWLTTVTKIDGVRFIPVDTEIATKSVELSEFHKDPADRMIVSTARKFSVPLVTKDEKIRAYQHVRTIW